MARLMTMVCVVSCLLAPACRFEPEEPDGASGPNGDAKILPEKYTCAKTKTAPFAPLSPKQVVADLAPTGAPPPVVTDARETAAPWGTTITISGNLGKAEGGEYVSFGEGSREIRVPPSSWSETRASVVAPLGAEGKIVVHTRGGTADAGTLAPPWRSSAVVTFESQETYGQTLASLQVGDATYVVRSAQRDLQGDPNARRLSIYRITAEGVSVAVLDDLGVVMRASLARGRDDRAIDLAVVAGTSRLHVARIAPDAIELDDGCVPADANGPLAFANGEAGRVAWVTIAKEKRALARLVDADGAGTWRVDRVVVTKDTLRGDGVELADGTVGFAWGEGAGGFLDAKAKPMVAVLPAGAAEVEITELASAMDDYVQTRLFASGAGLVMTWCNSDDTGFLADTGAGGVRCRVLARTGAREWKPFDGYPDQFENVRHDFGFVAGHVASVHRVRPSGEHVYRATVDATPSVVALSASEISFVRNDGSAPALFVTNGASAIVAFAR